MDFFGIRLIGIRNPEERYEKRKASGKKKMSLFSSHGLSPGHHRSTCIKTSAKHYFSFNIALQKRWGYIDWVLLFFASPIKIDTLKRFTIYVDEL